MRCEQWSAINRLDGHQWCWKWQETRLCPCIERVCRKELPSRCTEMFVYVLGMWKRERRFVWGVVVEFTVLGRVDVREGKLMEGRRMYVRRSALEQGIHPIPRAGETTTEQHHLTCPSKAWLTFYTSRVLNHCCAAYIQISPVEAKTGHY